MSGKALRPIVIGIAVQAWLLLMFGRDVATVAAVAAVSAMYAALGAWSAQNESRRNG